MISQYHWCSVVMFRVSDSSSDFSSDSTDSDDGKKKQPKDVKNMEPNR
jgi:hypothetical protein